MPFWSQIGQSRPSVSITELYNGLNSPLPCHHQYSNDRTSRWLPSPGLGDGTANNPTPGSKLAGHNISARVRALGLCLRHELTELAVSRCTGRTPARWDAARCGEQF